MTSETNPLNAIVAVLQAQSLAQSTILESIQSISAKAGVLNSAMSIVVDEIRDSLPVPSSTLDKLSGILEDSSKMEAGTKKADAEIGSMIDVTSKMLDLLKAQVAPDLPEPPAGLERWVN